MSALSDGLERLRALVFRQRQERDLDDELRFHVEREAEERRRNGADAHMARRDALVALGGVERLKEDVRDARGVRPLHDIASDVRYALRSLRRNPIFTLAAVLVLGLGIGASTAVYSMADAVLLSDLPYPDPDRLVRIYQTNSITNRWSLSLVDIEAIRDRNRTLSAFGAMQGSEAALSGVGSPEQIRVGKASAGFFQAVGIPAARGRLVAVRDEALSAPPVVVVSDKFAQRVLGGAAGAVGRAITLDGVSRTVVGVLPPGVDELGGLASPVWAAMQVPPPTRRGPFGYRGIGRLKSGVTLEMADRDLRSVSRAIYPLWSSGHGDSTARFIPLSVRETILGNANRQIGLFAGAVALVLLIAIANVAMLMLVRASTREQEMAVRTALGARRSRIARLLVTESLMLTFVAMVAGLVVAAAGLRAANVLVSTLPRIQQAALNWHGVAFAVAAAVVSGFLISLSPLSLALGGPAPASLGTDARRVGTGQRTNTLRGAFVVAEFALALPLLFGAGLLLNSFVRLQQVNPGVDPNGVVVAAFGLPLARYPTPEAREAFWQRLEQRAGEQPGVIAVGLGAELPPSANGNTNDFVLVDHPVPSGAASPTSPWLSATATYFKALGVPLLDGRLFTIADSGSAPPVVVVSRSWANHYFPGEQAVGRTLVEGGCWDCPRTTIIGVVGDVKYQGLAGDGDAVYTPITQSNGSSMYLVVHSKLAGAAALRALREVLGALDADLPIAETTLRERLETSIADPRHWTTVLGTFAASAVVLAAIGIFGLMSYIVRQRRREIGVRMALGAQPASVLWMIVVRGMRYAVPGTAIGLGLVVLEGRWLNSFLFGVGAMDPGTLAGVIGLLIAVAFVACWLPGWRASRIDPVRAIAAD
jgi:predicted permease